jgi:hypothetical protein
MTKEQRKERTRIRHEQRKERIAKLLLPLTNIERVPLPWLPDVQAPGAKCGGQLPLSEAEAVEVFGLDRRSNEALYRQRIEALSSG